MRITQPYRFYSVLLITLMLTLLSGKTYSQMNNQDFYSELNILLQVDQVEFENRIGQLLESNPNDPIVLGFNYFYQAAYFPDGLEVDFFKNLENGEFLFLSLAALKINSENYKEAIQLLEKARVSDTSNRNMWILNQLYIAHKGLGEDHIAWKYLEESIDLDPTFIPFRIEMSYNLDQGQNCEEIIELLEPVVAVCQDSDVYSYFGSALLNCGSTDEAINYFQKSITINDNPGANRMLGEIYHYERIDFEKSLNYFKKCLSLDSNDFDCIVSLGWLYLSMDKIGLAEQCFTDLLKVVNDHEAYAQVIQFYIQANNLERAFEMNEKDRKHNENSFYNEGFDLVLELKTNDSNHERLLQLTSQFTLKYGETEKLWLESVIRDL